MRQNVSTLVAVAVAALVVGAGAAVAIAAPGQQSVGQTQNQVPQQSAPQSAGSSSIAVSASGTAASAADQATVRVAVVATAESAPTVRRRLAENVSQMREALSELGVDGNQIQTDRYDLRRDERRPRREGGESRNRYRAIHSFSITVTDLNETGQIIDTAVTNGADNVEDIRYTLSSEQRRSLRTQALQDAMGNARSQAETLAAASGQTITSVHTVRTTERYHRPRFEATAAANADANTDLESGPVGVQVQVHVTYNATSG